MFRARIVLCVIGPWVDLSLVSEIVARHPGFELDREFSQTEHDERMEKSFEVSADRVTPSMTDDDMDAIYAHEAVAYILSPFVETGSDIAQEALVLAGELLALEGTALKCESSGIAHGRRRWLDLARDNDLYHAWVRRPLLDDETLYSCGMHLLGLPDIEATIDDPDPMVVVGRIDDRAAALIRGEQFPTTACTRYEEAEFFYNPVGYTRAD